MITMLSAMRLSLTSLTRNLIIGLCLCGLSACSALRIGYNQGETLVWWWIDGYADFSTEQAPRVKDAIHQWFVWHRATQLPGYADLLVSAQAQVLQPATPAQACRWADELRERIGPLIAHALPLAAPIVPTLTPEQLAHIERQYRKTNDEFQEDFLQDKPEERLKASTQRAIDRGEMLYGKLDERQRRMLAVAIAASPFDADVWFAERQAMQRETLLALRKVSAQAEGSAGRDAAALAALQALSQRAQQPPAIYRAYQKRLTDYNCALAAQLHNSTTPTQRQAARAKLKSWEDDVRALIAQGSNGSG
jgi:Family of unknown function (DUF6279)